MIVYTDSTTFADQMLQEPLSWTPVTVSTPRAVRDSPLLEEFFPDGPVQMGRFQSAGLWRRLILIERQQRSQWERLGSLARRGARLSDGILCLAGWGEGFRGLKDRIWVGEPGNVHMAAYLSSHLPIAEVGAGFSILPTLAVLDTIDLVPGLRGRAQIKWVNDVVIDDRKVAGVLTQTQCVGDLLKDVIMGLGVNVETRPEAPTDRFVPAVASLREFAASPEACTQKRFWPWLARAVRLRYQDLRAGRLARLLDDYRSRSIIIGRPVAVYDDSTASQPEIASGKVTAIGDNLELHLEGQSKPVTRGRLALLE
jgi:biotin-[acetyl-CoA-carboxylase] ligase BirA-like protein